MNKTYLIKEIFGPTIKGEGSHAGKVVNFLRFAGCNRWTGKEKDRHNENTVCSFCDTNFINGQKMTKDQIVGQLKELNSKAQILVISGGEPLLQLDFELAEELAKTYELHLETNGSKRIQDMRRFLTHVTMSPKQGLFGTKLEYCNDLKILFPYINDKITYEEFIYFYCDTAYLQPMWGTPTEDAIEECYKHKHLHLSVQNHKILGLK